MGGSRTDFAYSTGLKILQTKSLVPAKVTVIQMMTVQLVSIVFQNRMV